MNTMDTDFAIKIIKNECKLPFKYGDKIIALLERGKKFEKMWGKLCECVYRINRKYSNIRNLIEKLEIKYFPETYAYPKKEVK